MDYSVNPAEDSGGYVRRCTLVYASMLSESGFQNLAGVLLMQRAAHLFNPECRARPRLNIQAVAGLKNERSFACHLVLQVR